MLHLAGKVLKCTHTHTQTPIHTQLAETHCSLHNRLPCDTYLRCKSDCLAFTRLCISPFQPCISAVITIHTDFFPSRFRIRRCRGRAACTARRRNTASETQGIEVGGLGGGGGGGGGERNASFGCGATAQHSIMMFLNGGACLVTRVPLSKYRLCLWLQR